MDVRDLRFRVVDCDAAPLPGRAQPRTFDVAGHPLLCDEAQRLSPEALAAAAELAADLLGLSMVDFAGNEAAAAPRAAHAIVLQINWQLTTAGATGASDAARLESETRGPMSRKYRVDPNTGTAALVSPLAAYQAKAVRIAYGRWADGSSLR